MAAERLALHVLSILLLARLSLAATPDEICAASEVDQRVALNQTAFVSCYNSTVWAVNSCPRDLLFEEASQACVPNTGASLIPAPLPSPNATASPSIFLYVWAGNDNPGPQCLDAVVVLDGTPESATFGKVLNVTYTPTFGNEPHHVGLSNGTFLAVGGIMSYLRGNPDIYIFNVSQATAPAFITSVDPPLSAVTDSFIAQPDGGFWVTQMGDATGGTPGRVVRLSGNFSVVKEFPDQPPAGFNPHGFAIDAARQRLVTADYMELKSTLTGPGINDSFLGTGEFTYRHTLRVWQLPEFTLAGEFDAGKTKSQGFMTVQFIGSTGLAVSGSGRGALWAINATNPSDVRLAHFIGRDSSSCVMIPLAFSAGKRFLVTVLGIGIVQLVDSSDPWRWRTIQEIYLPEGTYPHAATATRNGTLVAVSTYYLDQSYNNGTGIGVLRQLGSRQVYFFDILDNGDRLQLNSRVPVVDFKNDVNAFRNETGNPPCGQWRPHGMVFKAPAPPAPPAAPAQSVAPPPSPQTGAAPQLTVSAALLTLAAMVLATLLM